MRAEARKHDDPPADSPVEIRRMRALLVEDDLHHGNLLAWLLRTEGWSVVQATSGGELLEWIGAATSLPRPLFDLIVADVAMPGLSAIEALSGWRHGDRSVPFVVVAAEGDLAIRAKAHALGAIAVLQKPIQAHALRGALSQALERNRASDGLRPSRSATCSG